MFPLGSVLFPTMVLPLHVFEDRYRALVADCLEGDKEFGVCLIERGHEVGGGDVRSGIGTVAQIVDAQRFPDGRWAIAGVGTWRFRVDTWREDAPYPTAEVNDWPDEPAGSSLDERCEQTLAQLRRVLALGTEAGAAVTAPTVEIAEDPLVASYQMSAVSPTGSFDRQRLLAAPGPSQRLSLLAELLGAAEEDFARQIGLE